MAYSSGQAQPLPEDYLAHQTLPTAAVFSSGRAVIYRRTLAGQGWVSSGSPRPLQRLQHLTRRSAGTGPAPRLRTRLLCPRDAPGLAPRARASWQRPAWFESGRREFAEPVWCSQCLNQAWCPSQEGLERALPWDPRGYLCLAVEDPSPLGVRSLHGGFCLKYFWGKNQIHQSILSKFISGCPHLIEGDSSFCCFLDIHFFKIF